MFGLFEVIKTIGHALVINWTNLLNQYGLKKKDHYVCERWGSFKSNERSSKICWVVKLWGCKKVF
jgi:hypothetical protein